MDHQGPFPPSKRGNTGFYNFVSKNGSQLIVSVKSTSDGLACLKMAHIQLGKPKYLRMDRQSNLLSSNPSIRTEFEAFNDSVGTMLKTTARHRQPERPRRVGRAVCLRGGNGSRGRQRRSDQGVLGLCRRDLRVRQDPYRLDQARRKDPV